MKAMKESKMSNINGGICFTLIHRFTYSMAINFIIVKRASSKDLMRQNGWLTHLQQQPEKHFMEMENFMSSMSYFTFPPFFRCVGDCVPSKERQMPLQRFTFYFLQLQSQARKLCKQIKNIIMFALFTTAACSILIEKNYCQWKSCWNVFPFGWMDVKGNGTKKEWKCWRFLWRVSTIRIHKLKSQRTWKTGNSLSTVRHRNCMLNDYHYDFINRETCYMPKKLSWWQQ